MSNDLNKNENNVNVQQNNGDCNCGCQTQDRVEATRLPRTDIYQSGEDVILELDMPGVSREKVNVQVENNILTLTGKLEQAPSQWSLIHCETVQRDYERAFELGPDVDLDRITATMNDGVLKVTLPKVQSAKARKIEVCA